MDLPQSPGDLLSSVRLKVSHRMSNSIQRVVALPHPDLLFPCVAGPRPRRLPETQTAVFHTPQTTAARANFPAGTDRLIDCNGPMTPMNSRGRVTADPEPFAHFPRLVCRVIKCQWAHREERPGPTNEFNADAPRVGRREVSLAAPDSFLESQERRVLPRQPPDTMQNPVLQTSVPPLNGRSSGEAAASLADRTPENLIRRASKGPRKAPVQPPRRSDPVPEVPTRASHVERLLPPVVIPSVPTPASSAAQVPSVRTELRLLKLVLDFHGQTPQLPKQTQGAPKLRTPPENPMIGIPGCTIWPQVHGFSFPTPGHRLGHTFARCRRATTCSFPTCGGLTPRVMEVPDPVSQPKPAVKAKTPDTPKPKIIPKSHTKKASLSKRGQSTSTLGGPWWQKGKVKAKADGSRPDETS